MGTLNEDLSAIKEVEDKIIANKVARFAYTDEAYTTNDANGVAEYDVNKEQNIPTADASVLKVNETVLSKGYRAQASSITRMLVNHFFGRMSYNLNKVNDNVSNLIATLIGHRGTANGFATLDASGRVPYSQLPESAMEYKGQWNAETNTPTLADGTGTKGDFYIVSVAGTQNLGSGNIQFFVNDRVIYDGSVWSRLSAGDVKTVNSVLPTNGNVALTGENIPISSTDPTLLSAPLATNRYADHSVTVKKVNFTFKDVMAKTPRWLRFDFSTANKQTLKIAADTHIRVGNTVVHFDTDTSIDLSETINAETSPNGKDWYVFLDANGNVTCSLTKTETSGTKRIGQFHTLCVDAGASLTGKVATELTQTGENFLIKQYNEEEDPDFYAFYNKPITAITSGAAYNVGTVAHPLSGFEANDILPESVWCLTFHPACASYDGMVYDRDCDIAVDIYLQSGKGKATRSAFGAQHTVARTQISHTDDMRCVGKRLLSDPEFTSIASGSNECTPIYGSADVSTVGGHKDTANRRMISFIGCEECCGYIIQWLRDVAPNGGSSWSVYDDSGAFGQLYGVTYGFSAGGYWVDSSLCGSRCRYSSSVLSYTSTNIGGRGSIWCLGIGYLQVMLKRAHKLQPRVYLWRKARK